MERCHCNKRCYEDIDDVRRKRVNEQFRQNSNERQRDWLIQVVKPVDVKRVKLDGEGRKKERYCQFQYYLPNENGEVVNACQVYCLRTLGVSSNKKIVHLFKNQNPGDISASLDQRGKHVPANISK